MKNKELKTALNTAVKLHKSACEDKDKLQKELDRQKEARHTLEK